MPALASSRRPPADPTCVGCGYDLRGLPQSGRCPECGTAIAESAASMRLDSAPAAVLMRLEMSSEWMRQTLRLPLILVFVLVSAAILTFGAFITWGNEAIAQGGLALGTILLVILLVLLPLALCTGAANLAARPAAPVWRVRLAPWQRLTLILASAAFCAWLLPSGLLIAGFQIAGLAVAWAELGLLILLPACYLRYLAALAIVARRAALARRCRWHAAASVPIVGVWSVATASVALALDPIGGGLRWPATLTNDPFQVAVLWGPPTLVLFVWLSLLSTTQRHMTAAISHARRRAESGVVRRAANCSSGSRGSAACSARSRRGWPAPAASRRRSRHDARRLRARFALRPNPPRKG